MTTKERAKIAVMVKGQFQRQLASKRLRATIDKLGLSPAHKRRLINEWDLYDVASAPDDFPLFIDDDKATLDDLDRFMRKYVSLEKSGKSDFFGGAESQRVWDEWVCCWHARRPQDVYTGTCERIPRTFRSTSGCPKQ